MFSHNSTRNSGTLARTFLDYSSRDTSTLKFRVVLLAPEQDPNLGATFAPEQDPNLGEVKTLTTTECNDAWSPALTEV